jgi:hypothetical protein
MPLDFADDIFLLDFPLEAAQSTLKRFSIAQSYFSHVKVTSPRHVIKAKQTVNNTVTDSSTSTANFGVRRPVAAFLHWARSHSERHPDALTLTS